jgi:CO/xanthine dehydrogenase FAD-binding subunit
MTPLNDIISLGKAIPEAFLLSLKSIGTPQMRNSITIGGNICCAQNGLSASLIALDARYELRSGQGSRLVSAARFCEEKSDAPGLELISRVRIPLGKWNFSSYMKFDPGIFPAPHAVMIASIEEDRLNDICTVYAGEAFVQNDEANMTLSGKRLPLDAKDAAHYLALWENAVPEAESPGIALSGFHKAQLLRFIETSLQGLE